MRLIQLCVIASVALLTSATRQVLSERALRASTPAVAEVAAVTVPEVAGEALFKVSRKENDLLADEDDEDETSISLEDVIEGALAAHDADKAKQAETGFFKSLLSKTDEPCDKKGLFKPMDLVMFSQATEDMRGTGKGLEACLTKALMTEAHKGAIGVVGYRGQKDGQEVIETKIHPLHAGKVLDFKHDAETYFGGLHGPATPSGVVKALLETIDTMPWNKKHLKVIVYPAPDQDLSTVDGNDEVKKCLNGDKTSCALVSELVQKLAANDMYLAIMRVKVAPNKDFIQKLTGVAGLSERTRILDGPENGTMDKGWCKAHGKKQTLQLLNSVTCLSEGQ